MAPPQRQDDVHQDDLCPLNKRYALMDANKKIDLHNPLKALTMTLDDFKTIFQLPQATDNNLERFVAAPKFSEMVSFFLNGLGFTLELRSPSNFKTTGVVQPWQTLRLHYSLEHQSTLIPYPRFTKLIVSHYITAYPEISRRFRDKYHNLKHDEMVKSIFNSGKNKVGVGMRIPSWMITDEIKLTENYQMYADVFGKSHDDLEAQYNVEKVKEHLVAEEIEKMVEGTKSVESDEVDNSILNSQNDPDTRLDPRSYKESLEVEKTTVAQPINIIEEEEESAEDDYELRRRVEGKNVDESRNTPSPTTIRSLRIHSTLISLDTKKLQELMVTNPTPSSSTPSSSSSELSVT
ncbi:hypothetical protein Tco_0667726 [Tanacetum coccineum]